MTGLFGDIARTVGSTGNDVANATFATRDLATQTASDKLKQIMAKLQIQDIQNRLSEFGQVKPSGVERGQNGELNGIVFNPKTGKYELQNLAQGAAPAGIDKEKFRSQLLQQANDPNATGTEKKVLTGLIGSLDAGGAPEKVMEDYNRFLGSRSETGTAPKPELKTEIFSGYKWQYDPAKKIPGTRDATGQYVRLGMAKEPGTTGGVDMDALISDIATGRAKMPPAGKFAAQLAKRAKEMGVTLPSVDMDIRKIAADAQKSIQVYNGIKGIDLSKPNETTSLALARAADSLFGGTTYSADLKQRITSYLKSSQFDKAEMQDIVKRIKDEMDSRMEIARQAYQDAGLPIPPPLRVPDLSDLGGKPVNAAR
jgi:hypothetical protein